MTKILFSTIRSIFVSYFYTFKESFIYYPVILAIGGFALFLLTSRIDEMYGSSFYPDGEDVIFFLEPIFFAGSPHAARSILSTIATAWATILGVAFSVTLITLQLSVTKYSAEIINEFQSSKTNQLTLALFIFVVTFSLLVLKTVRTGEDGSFTFTPILGVNISVYAAVVALFVFVIFLSNISSYLKPNNLIRRVVDKVLHSVKRDEERRPDRRFSLDMIASNYEGNEILAIRSPRRGIIRSIDWKRISNQIGKQSSLRKLEAEQPQLLLKWRAVTGDQVEKEEIICKLYVLESLHQSRDFLRNNTDNKTIEQSVRDVVLAGLDIASARRISSDPNHGLDILRNIAVRAIDQSDIGIAAACISGLFGILRGSMETLRSSAAPFMIPFDKNPRGKYVATVISGERNIAYSTMAQLSIIFKTSSMSDTCRTKTAEYFSKDYMRLARLLLDDGNIEGFETLTDWYSKQLSLAIPSYSSELKKELEDILVQFSRDIGDNHPYASDIARIHLGGIFASEA